MLGHSLVTPKSGKPAQYMLFLHGILGTRANWRGLARRFVDRRPGWGALLIDLPEHGDSVGSSPPHTLAAAASQVAAVQEALDLSVAGALGHSFGGKVVLEWLRGRGGQPTEAWIIDSSPSTSTADRQATVTAEVLRILATIPRRWPSREAFVAAVVEAGQPAPIANWLAMNLRREDGGRTFGPDLVKIRTLLDDYARTDFWGIVQAPPDLCTIDIVIGERSPAFSAADRQKLASVADENEQVTMHIVKEAGHWVHVDRPDAIVALLTSRRSPTR